MENWDVPSVVSDTRTIQGIGVTLRSNDELAGDWWRGGYDVGATFATDGIVGSSIQIVLTDLPPGRHTLTTWHNHLQTSKSSRYTVRVNDQVVLENVEPSVRVTHDDDAAAAHVAFDAVTGKETVITISPDGSGEFDRVTLNGFEIDGPNPATSAKRPFPADRDGHAPKNPTLTWQPAPGATKHLLYLATSEQALASAEKPTAELSDPSYTAEGLSHHHPYFWRVDQVIDGVVHRGRAWRFEVQHLAFPGAEGYGRFAKGGRGGRVIEVANLNDSGPGSLREAVEADGPRTVVFRVGGTIELKSKLVINNSHLTIAGQTAPGDGIAIRGYTFGMMGARDVIIRYLRIRPGDESGLTMDGTGFASSDHCIMDHCSISWSIDETVSSRGAKNITLQRSIVAEALNVAGHARYESGKQHGFAGSISGDIGSFHHNLIAHCAGRNWSLAGGLTRGGKYAGRLDIRNNVFYNWGYRTNDGGAKAVQIVGNLYIPGEATTVFHFLQPDGGSPEDPQQYYMVDNKMEGRPQYDADNWQNGGSNMRRVPMAQVRVDQPFWESHVTTRTPEEAYETVMADVGANLPASDSADQRVLGDVRERKTTAKGSKTGKPGLIDSQQDVGGWPELKSGSAPEDADRDGMADWWEKEHGLDPTNPEDRNGDFNGDGYTNLEKYLNWIVENRGLWPAAKKG